MTTARQSRTSAPGTLRSLLLTGGLLFIVFVVERAGRKLMGGVPLAQLPVSLTPWAILWILTGLVFIPGFLLAERAATSRGRAVPFTVLVLLGSVLVGAIAPLLVEGWLGFPVPQVGPPGSPDYLRTLMPIYVVLVRMGLVALIYAGHRERLDAAQAIQALETRRDEMMGRLAASRLEAARARVQPEAFIAELRALRSNYLEDSASAGTRLDALITRLRVASRSAAP